MKSNKNQVLRECKSVISKISKGSSFSDIETFLDYSQFQWMLLGDDDLYNSYEKALYNRRLSINDMIKKLMLEGQLGEMQSDEMALISKVIKLSKEMDTMKNYIISFYTPLPDTVVANFDKKLELRKELCKTLK